MAQVVEDDDFLDSVVRAELAQRQDRVNLLAEDTWEAHGAMRACLLASEREILSARSRAGVTKEDQAEAWADALQVLRKTRVKMESLIRQEESILALYAAECGLNLQLPKCTTNLLPDSDTPIIERSNSPDAAKTEDQSAYFTPNLAEVKFINTSLKERSSEITLSHTPSKRTSWEVRVLEKISQKLTAKRDHALKNGQPVARIDTDLGKISEELRKLSSQTTNTSVYDDGRESLSLSILQPQTPSSTLDHKISANVLHSDHKSTSRKHISFQQENIPRLDWGISPVQQPKSSGELRTFEDMICKIAVGQTPPKLTSNSKHNAKREIVTAEDDDILDLISTSPIKTAKPFSDGGISRNLFDV